MNLIHNLIVKFVRILPRSVVFLFAKKYIAGTKLGDAVRVVRDLNEKGIVATMDVLGEAISNLDEALEAKKECIEVLETIEKENLDANLSVKPTQLGLALDKDFCFEQFREIVAKAKSLNNFVRIDMEDSSVTDLTFELFEKLQAEFDNVGIVVQSYLRRTFDDVSKLNGKGTNYRLCKGIYVEPEKIAFKDRQEVRDSYVRSMKKMIEDQNYIGIATHDDYLVDAAYEYLKQENIEGSKYEFQMLYGVKEDLRDRINADGHKIRIYVPYGEHWYHYSVRRLQENPTLAWYITKSFFTSN